MTVSPLVYRPFTQTQKFFYEHVALVCGIKLGRCARTCTVRVTGIPDDDGSILMLLEHRAAGSERTAWMKLGTFAHTDRISQDIIDAVERGMSTLTEGHEVVH